MQTTLSERLARVPRPLFLAVVAALAASCAPHHVALSGDFYATVFRWPSDDSSIMRTVASDTPALGNAGFLDEDEWNRFAFGALTRLCRDRSARLTPSLPPLSRIQWDSLCSSVPSASFASPCIVRTTLRGPATSLFADDAWSAASVPDAPPRACVAPASALAVDVVAATGVGVSLTPAGTIELGDLPAGTTRHVDLELRNRASNGGAVTITVRADEGAATPHMIVAGAAPRVPCGAAVPSGASCHVTFDVTPIDDDRRALGVEVTVATRAARRTLPLIPIHTRVWFGAASLSFTVADATGRSAPSHVVTIPPGDIPATWASQPGLQGICIPVGGTVQAFLSATSAADGYSLGASAASTPGWTVVGNPARIVPVGRLFVIGSFVQRIATPVPIATVRASAPTAGRLLVTDLLRGSWGTVVGSHLGRTRSDFVALLDTDRLCRLP